MSKPSNPRRQAENEAKATTRMLRVSPQKLNLLAQLIRGKKVATALADLEFSNKRISVEVKKTLESAIANATAYARRARLSCTRRSVARLAQDLRKPRHLPSGSPHKKCG